MRGALGIGAAAGVAAVCLACLAPARSVRTEGPEEMGLARYRVFGFAPELSAGGDPAFDPDARQRAERALMDELLSRGFSFADRRSADLLFAIGVSAPEVPGPDAVPECRLVVDAIDARTRERLWRGSSACRRRLPHRLDVADLQEGVRAIARELPGA